MIYVVKHVSLRRFIGPESRSVRRSCQARKEQPDHQISSERPYAV